MLLPLEQLAQCVVNETGTVVDDATLDTYIAEELIPVLPGAGPGGDQLGFPLYAPSRVGLFSALQQRGYALTELRKFAEFEEMMIDCILTIDDLAYENDDVRLLLVHAEEQIEIATCRLRQLQDGDPLVPVDDPAAAIAEAQERIASARQTLDTLTGVSLDRLSDAHRHELGRVAFQVRMLNEFIRINAFEPDRAKMKTGYSPWVLFQHSDTTWQDGKTVHHFQGIAWRSTVHDAMVVDEEDDVGIRLPGVHLLGDRVVLTDGVSPAEYERRWREHALDGYFQARAAVLGERVCLHCQRALPDGASNRKRYCGEACRQAAKQKRFRTRHPDKIMAIQQRYWTT